MNVLYVVKDQSAQALCSPLMISFCLQKMCICPVVMIDVRTAEGKRKYLDYQYFGLDQKLMMVLICCLMDQNYLSKQMESCNLLVLEIVDAYEEFLDYFFLQFRQGDYVLLLLCGGNHTENSLKIWVKNRYRVEEENIIVGKECRQLTDSFQKGNLYHFFSSAQAKIVYSEYFEQVKSVAQKLGIGYSQKGS